MRNLLTVLVAVLGSGILVSDADAKEKGFHGSFEFRWLNVPDGEHRDMVLLSTVSFVDSQGREWTVPPETPIDGASIPWGAWSLFGSPYVGNYRRASVIHDHYCDIIQTGPDEVHAMFLEAMREDGVGAIRADLMFAAVTVYSELGGKCGKADHPAKRIASGRYAAQLPQSQRLGDFLASPDIFSEFALPGMETLKQRVELTAGVQHPQTFKALLAVLTDPYPSSYIKLLDAIDLERPDRAQIEALSALAAATADHDPGLRRSPRE